MERGSRASRYLAVAPLPSTRTPRVRESTSTSSSVMASPKYSCSLGPR